MQEIIEVIFPIVIVLFMLMFMLTFIMMLYMMLKGLKRFRVYYPPRRTINEISKGLMCPRCGSKELKSIGYYTLKCDKCGFIFTVGFREGVWISPLFLFFPVFWPFIPIIIWKKMEKFYF